VPETRERGRTEKEKSLWEEHLLLLIGAGVSFLLLLAFLVVQGSCVKPVLELSSQWLWVAVVPILTCLVAGRYIGKVKVSTKGIEAETYIPPKVKGVAELPPGPKPAEAPAAEAQPGTAWVKERKAEYKRTNGHFLVHVYKPSRLGGQKYDVFVYLVRHVRDSVRPEKTGLPEIEKVEFYFGPSWRDEVFTVVNNGSNVLGVRTHAYGTFLATAQVTFKPGLNKSPVILHRYLDCEMMKPKAKRVPGGAAGAAAAQQPA
jgi:hypothetical protein